MAGKQPIVAADRIEQAVLLIRGHKVMLDRDLATLYGVAAGRLIEAVRRNKDRFPRADLMFQLTSADWANLKSQFAIPGSGWSGRRSTPYAFTEQGVAMLSSVLRSKRSVHAIIEIIRAFVRLRHNLAAHLKLAKRLEELEQKQDAQFRVVFDAIRQLMTPPRSETRKHRFPNGNG